MSYVCVDVEEPLIVAYPRLHHRYRFAEIHYLRPETTHKGKQVAARVESVVVFMPDVWMCSPTRLDYTGLQAAYAKRLQRQTAALDGKDVPPQQALSNYLSCFSLIQCVVGNTTLTAVVTVKSLVLAECIAYFCSQVAVEVNCIFRCVFGEVMYYWILQKYQLNCFHLLIFLLKNIIFFKV